MIKPVLGAETIRLPKSPTKFEGENRIKPFIRAEKQELLSPTQKVAKQERLLEKTYGVKIQVSGNITLEQRAKVLSDLELNLGKLTKQGIQKIVIAHGTTDKNGNYTMNGIPSADLDKIGTRFSKNDNKTLVIACEADKTRIADGTEGYLYTLKEGKSEFALKNGIKGKNAVEVGLHPELSKQIKIEPNPTNDLNLNPLTEATHGIEQTDFLALFEGTTSTPVAGGAPKITGGKINLEKLYQALNGKIIPAGKLQDFLTELEAKIGTPAFSELKGFGWIEGSPGSYTIGKSPQLYPTPIQVFNGMEDEIPDPHDSTRKLPNKQKQEYEAAFEYTSASFHVKDLGNARTFFFNHILDDNDNDHETYKSLLDSLSPDGQKNLILTFMHCPKGALEEKRFILSYIKSIASSAGNHSDVAHLETFIQEKYLKGQDGSSADTAAMQSKIDALSTEIGALKNNQPKPIASAKPADQIKGAGFKTEDHGIEFNDSNIGWIDSSNSHIDLGKLHDAIKDIPTDKQDAFFNKLKAEIGETAFNELEGKVYTKNSDGKFSLKTERPQTGSSIDTSELATKDDLKNVGAGPLGWAFRITGLAGLIAAIAAFINGNKAKDETTKQFQGFVQQLGQTLQGTLGSLSTQVDSLNQQLGKTRKQLGNIVDSQNKAMAISMGLNYDDGVQSLNYSDDTQSMNEEPTPPSDPAIADDTTPTETSQPDTLDKAEKAAKQLEEKAKQKQNQPPTSSSSGSGLTNAQTQQPPMQTLVPGQSPLSSQQGLTSAAPGIVPGYGNVPAGMVTIDSTALQSLISKAASSQPDRTQFVQAAGVPASNIFRLG